MHVVVTGAAGYVGKALVRHLAGHRSLRGRPVSRLTLLDRQFDSPAPEGAIRLSGDLGDTAWLQDALAGQAVDVLFHLASVPGGTAEQDPALGRRVNLQATETLLDTARAQVLAGGPSPVWVFASSIAVLGRLSAPVTDDTLPRPAMTYGAHKLIGEILVSDYSRRAWVDGRSLRLPGVLARPPARTGQLSAFLSDIIRELAAGRPFVCPTSPQATTWASSLPCVVAQLVHAAELELTPDVPERAWTMPALCFSMAELVQAIEREFRTPVQDLVRYVPDDRIEALFGRFPPLSTGAADALGFKRDADLGALVRASLAPEGR